MANDMVPNPIAAAAEALRTGKDIEQAVYGTPGNSASDPGNNTPEVSYRPEIDVLDGNSPEPEASDGQTEKSAQDGKEAPSSIDTTVKVSGKEAEKKAAPKTPDKVKQYELGMRKFQAERDALKKEKEALAKEHDELKNHWSSLEKAYAEKGIAGVLNLVAGDEKAYDAHLSKEFERKKLREEATPAQRERMDLEERLARLESEKTRSEKRATDLEAKVLGDKQAAEQKELQSVVNPLFDKYRFTGKLGDEESEYYYDKALWKETMANLDQLPEEQITREVIEGEFKKVASAFRKVVNKQVETKTKNIIETKKRDSAESAATRAMTGMTNSASVDEFRKNMRSGNIQDAFRQLVSGKIKLS